MAAGDPEAIGARMREHVERLEARAASRAAFEASLTPATCAACDRGTIRRRDAFGEDEWTCGRIEDRACAFGAEVFAARVAAEDQAVVSRLLAHGVPRRLVVGAPPASLPARLGGAHVRKTTAMAAVVAYRAEGLAAGRALVLAGPTGRGKSWAAAALLRSLRLRPPEYEWMFAGEVHHARFDDERWAYLCKVELLVLDDLGLEHHGEGGWTMRALDELVYARHGGCLATVITTNLPMTPPEKDPTAAALTQLYDGRIVSRLRDWADIGRINKDEPDLRRPGAVPHG